MSLAMSSSLFNRILIVNPFGIGDVLFTTPLIAALKDKFPGVFIGYIGNARTVPFLRNDPRIDKVFCYERDDYVAVYKKSPGSFLFKWRSLVEEIRAEKFEVAFDLSLGSPLGLALAWAGIPERIGFDYKGRGRWLTRKIPLARYEGKHVAVYYLDLLELIAQGALGTRHSAHERKRRTSEGAKCGSPASGECRVASDRRYSMSIYVCSSDSDWAEAFIKANRLEAGEFVLIFPGGGASWGQGAALKRWSAENYAKLADKIIEKTSLAVILMGDRNEKELCETVKNVMRSPAINAAGGMSITQAAALIKGARFVVTNDGGPLHVAVACGVRTVSIFGPVDENVYGPFPRAGHLVAVKDLPCRPCYRNFRMSDCQHLSCLRNLTVDEVFNQVKELS